MVNGHIREIPTPAASSPVDDGGYVGELGSRLESPGSCSSGDDSGTCPRLVGMTAVDLVLESAA